MNATRRADVAVADRLRAAAERETLPGRVHGRTARELAAALAADSPHAARFSTEIELAVHGTALALNAAAPHPDDPLAHAGAAHRDPTVWFEQAIVLGHPTHPLARTRGGLDDDQTRAWAPEHRPRIPLGLYRIQGLTTSPDWPYTDHTGPLLPVHPWQAAHLALPEPARTLHDTAPLMSLRTLATGEHHLKCAVDLQLTSAIRRVSAAAAANAHRLSPLLSQATTGHGITVLPERSAIATGPDGPRPDLAAIVRPAPHTLGFTHAVPVAALAETCPSTGRPIAAALAGPDLADWWRALAPHLLAPLRLLAQTGIALEAHGQNTLIGLDRHHHPTRLIYRDLGGLRLPTTGWPRLAGDLQTDDADERTRKLLAALLPTTLTAIVEALATWTATDTARWWRPISDTTRALDLPTPLTEAVLDRPWPTKATTAMRLSDDPTADQWTTVANPLAAP